MYTIQIFFCELFTFVIVVLVISKVIIDNCYNFQCRECCRPKLKLAVIFILGIQRDFGYIYYYNNKIRQNGGFISQLLIL